MIYLIVVKIQDFLEKVPSLLETKFVKRGLDVALTTASFAEIRKSFIVAVDPTKAKSHRVISLVRGGCCTGALLTSYSSIAVGNPQLGIALKVGCGFFSSAYMISGGDVKVGMGFMFNSTKT